MEFDADPGAGTLDCSVVTPVRSDLAPFPHHRVKRAEVSDSLQSVKEENKQCSTLSFWNEQWKLSRKMEGEPEGLFKGLLLCFLS